jgi:hypothetical protein
VKGKPIFPNVLGCCRIAGIDEHARRAGEHDHEQVSTFRLFARKRAAYADIGQLCRSS